MKESSANFNLEIVKLNSKFDTIYDKVVNKNEFIIEYEEKTKFIIEKNA